jgi:hypothetical protein
MNRNHGRDGFDVARVATLLEAGSDPNATLAGLRFGDGEVERLTPLRLTLLFHEDRRPCSWRSPAARRMWSICC